MAPRKPPINLTFMGSDDQSNHPIRALMERTPNKTQGDDFARVQSTPVSVSKDDIELLENKILVLESQISKIKKKHMSVLSSGSSDVP